MNEPSRLTAGTTARWWTQYEDYDSADGWTLAYNFRGPGQFNASGVENQDGGWNVTIAPSATDGKPAGVYSWQAVLSRGLDERFVVEKGNLTLEADLAEVSTAYDGRSPAKKRLDALLALQQSFAEGKGAQSYAIFDRQMTFRTFADLQIAIDAARREVNAEEMDQGNSFFGNSVRVNFVRP